MVRWIQEALDAVPTDEELPVLEPPHRGGTVLGPVPDDLVPVLRAWSHCNRETARLRSSILKEGHRGAADALDALASTQDRAAREKTAADVKALAERLVQETALAEKLMRRAQCLNRVVYIGLEAVYGHDYEGVSVVTTGDGLTVIGYTTEEVMADLAEKDDTAVAGLFFIR